MSYRLVKKQWKKYCEEVESSEELDIEKHIIMALKVGMLLSEIERLNKKIEDKREENEGLKDSFYEISKIKGLPEDALKIALREMKF